MSRGIGSNAVTKKSKALSEAAPLVNLSSLDVQLEGDGIHSFKEIKAYLQNGWTNFLNLYGDLSPILIFPSEEMAIQRVDIFTLDWYKGLTLGKLIIETAWCHELTPRLYSIMPISPSPNPPKKILLKFTKRDRATFSYDIKAPSLSAVDKLLNQTETEFRTYKDNPRGKPLSEFVAELITTFHLDITIHPALKTQLIRVYLKTASLSEILDIVAYHFDAIWDWAGESICIRPKSSAYNGFMFQDFKKP